MIVKTGIRSTERKACPIVTLSAINPTLTGVGLNSDVRGERPDTNCLAGSDTLPRYLSESTQKRKDLETLMPNMGVQSIWNVMTHGDEREGKWRGKLANGVGSQYSSHYLETWCIQHYYRWCAHLGCQQSTINFKWLLLCNDIIKKSLH